MWSFPAGFLARFFHNHGMLGFRDRPQWRTVTGGSRRYVEEITRPFARPHPPERAGPLDHPARPRGGGRRPMAARPSSSTRW